MKTRNILFALILVSETLTSSSTDPLLLVKQVFGPTTIDLSLVSYHFMEDLFLEIKHTTPYEQMIASNQAAAALTQELEKREEQLVTAPEDAQSFIDYNISILTVQRDHFERVARLILQDMSKKQQYLGWLKNAWHRTITFFLKPFKPYISPVQRLTRDLLKYTEIERDEILVDHKKTLFLLVGHNKYKVPLIIRFWDYPRYRHRLLNGVKKMQGNAYPQAGAALAAAGDVLATAAESAAKAIADTAAAAAKTGAEATATAVVEAVGATADAAMEALADAGADLAEGLVTATEAAAKGLVDTSADVSATVAESIGEALAPATETLVSKATAETTFTAARDTAETATESAAQNTKESLDALAQAQAQEEKTVTQQAATETGTTAAVEEGQSITETGDQSFEGQIIVTGDQSLEEIPEETSAAEEEVTETKTEDEAEEAPKTFTEKLEAWAEKTFDLKEFGELLLNLILQSEISMGSQLVASWQSAKDALLFAKLSQQRTTLMTKLNHYMSALAVQRSNTMAQINADFSAKVALIAQQLCLQPTSSGTVTICGLMPSLFALEQAFMTQALTNATVKQIFFINALQEDQLFSLSPMVAQETIQSYQPFVSNGLLNTWYNPYRSGNWQFCSVDYSGTSQGPVTSFVQYTGQPFINTNYPNGDPTIAVQNSIFTDYIPPVQRNKEGTESYQISVECTLLAEPSTPFMMGVMFNGARWIPGILDLHHQHRLFCIYSLPGQKTGTYNVGFAETFYQSTTNSAQDQLADSNIAGLNAIWPAYQILSPAIDALAQQNNTTAVPNPIATIPALPVGTPYVLTINNEPNNVTLTISTKDGTVLFPAPESQAVPATPFAGGGINQLQKLNRVFFIYHNLGFTAPGCSAQFTIRQPQALCLSDAQQKAVNRLATSRGVSS